MRRCSRLLAALALASVPAALAAQEAEESAVERPALALMGTVPIYWGEAAGIDELLAGTAQPHWARAVLERDYALVPIDYLSPGALAAQQVLLMAQPRGLSGEENVALDAWVRDGGRLILFADPLLTGESRFGIGDRRRPQDVALLSPILAHWGLQLVFDVDQPEGPQQVDHFGTPMPVEMRGELRPIGETGYCAIPGDGLLAHCSIGLGQVMVVADAAMLDLGTPRAGAETALEWLLAHVFADLGDGAGNAAEFASESQRLGENALNPAVVGGPADRGGADSGL